MKEVSFPSRVDVWLILVPVIGLSFALGMGLWLSFSHVASRLMLLAIIAFPLLLSLLIAWPCRYTLKSDHLLIRFGIFSQRIAYEDIMAVALSSSARSAPALSLQRVKVSFGRSFQLVSPIDREWFVHALQERVKLAGAPVPHPGTAA